MNDDEREYLQAQEDQTLTAAAQQAGLRAAAQHSEQTVHNASFLEELRSADLDEDGQLDSVEDRYPSWFSGAHAVTNRGDDWDLQADLLMMNKRERAVTQRRPGRLLRDRPFLLATMRGDDSPPLDAYAKDEIPGELGYWRNIINGLETSDDVVGPEERARIYGAAEVSADLMTLAKNGAGLESVSTVKTETSVQRNEEENTTASRAAKILE